MDGFRVTGATCLCQGHFSEDDIERNPNRWKLVAGAVPSRNPYCSVTPRPTLKEPGDRSTSQLSQEMHENAYSSTTSLSLENAKAIDLGTCSEHDYPFNNDSLYQDILDLREKVKSLENENSQFREKLFSVDKLKNDDSAVCFYIGFPNFDTLMYLVTYCQS